MQVDEAIRARISTRAFKPDPISETVVREILETARWAPSGGNLQPWGVIAVAGEARLALIEAAKTALMDFPDGQEGDRPIYPPALWEPYRSRRYEVGELMYGLIGAPREDKFARLVWLTRNYEFFGAPVGLFFTIDRRMGHGQWAHLGMFIQTIALAAQARGLATCMQEAWARLRDMLHAHLALPEEQMVYCGMALGLADPDAAVNRLRTPRTEVDDFAQFKGF